jgi:hypothetical protein
MPHKKLKRLMKKVFKLKMAFLQQIKKRHSFTVTVIEERIKFPA